MQESLCVPAFSLRYPVTEQALHPWWRTGLEVVLVAVPGNWVPPIPGGMTGAAYQNYPNRAPPVILAGKPE